MKNNVYTRAAAFAAVSLALAGSLSASPLVLGDAGVDLGLVDTGVIYNALTIPVNSIYGNTWVTPLSGFATYMAPVSQFTGINDNGSLVPAGDLIPLRTTSISIVDPATNLTSFTIDKNFVGGGGSGGGVTNWTPAVPVTITGTIANPVMTFTRNETQYHTVGPQTYVRTRIIAPATSSYGVGDYIYTLPPGVAFDTSRYPLLTTGSGGAASVFVPSREAWTASAIPVSRGLFTDQVAGVRTGDAMVIVPYTATTYRVAMIDGAGAFYQGYTFYGSVFATEFEFPVN